MPNFRSYNGSLKLPREVWSHSRRIRAIKPNLVLKRYKKAETIGKIKTSLDRKPWKTQSMSFFYLGKPKENPDATMDPSKTLFIARLSYTAREKHLKRYESYSESLRTSGKLNRWRSWRTNWPKSQKGMPLWSSSLKEIWIMRIRRRMACEWMANASRWIMKGEELKESGSLWGRIWI